MVEHDGLIVISKTMSLTMDDFLRGIGVLGLKNLTEVQLKKQTVRFQVEQGYVDIQFEEREAKVLGGLLALPRACVTLNFYGVERGQILDYVARFDLAFQRGGG